MNKIETTNRDKIKSDIIIDDIEINQSTSDTQEELNSNLFPQSDITIKRTTLTSKQKDSLKRIMRSIFYNIDK